MSPGFLFSSRRPTAHEALKLLLLGKWKSLRSADQNHDACRSADHAGHLSQAAEPAWPPPSLARSTNAAISWRRLRRPVICAFCRCRCCCYTAPTIPSFRPPRCCGWSATSRKEYLVAALISPAIGHVDIGSKINLRERLALVHWMASMIYRGAKYGGRQRSGFARRDVARPGNSRRLFSAGPGACR